MLDTVFKTYSGFVGDAYKAFIGQYFSGNGERSDFIKLLSRLERERILSDPPAPSDLMLARLFNQYQDYALLDSCFPRPILTFLGVNIYCNELQDIAAFKDMQLLFIPQLIRDYGAIHDDIVDEDFVKFGCDTLPVVFSKNSEPERSIMNKRGMDMALLFGDMMVSAPLSIVAALSVESETKVKLLSLITQLLYSTNKGQIQELLLDEMSLEDIPLNAITTLYRDKAADYCYAFPLALGMVYSKLDDEIVRTMREVMLNIGIVSQIVNDIEGVFFEKFLNERDTLSDLTKLRRTYLLVKLQHKTISSEIKKLLGCRSLTKEQALLVKEEMIGCGVLTEVRCEVENKCEIITSEVKDLKIGSVLKAYLLDLIESRVITNIRKV